MKSSLTALCLFAGLPLAMFGQGKLSGKVTDFANGRGLFGVTVHMDNANGTPVKDYKDIVTEFDGAYEVNGLRPGIEYRATFSLDHYEPDIHPVTVTTMYSPVLKKYYASSEYWKSAAGTIGGRIQSLPRDKQPAEFSIVWEELKTSGISAAGKAELARSLKSYLPNEVWANSRSFQVYYEADPDKLKQLEIAFEKNSDVSSLPGLDPRLFEDIKVTQRKYHHITTRDYSLRQPDMKDESSSKSTQPRQTVVIPFRAEDTTTPAISKDSLDSMIKTDGAVKVDGVVKRQTGKVDDARSVKEVRK
jgi:hypothetical protein